MTSAAARQAGRLGWLAVLLILVTACAHGVVVGPDGAPWDHRRRPERDRAGRPIPLPPGRDSANLNTAAFRGGVLWFTGQAGVLGRLDPKAGRVEVFDAPRGPGPYGITTTPDGQLFYASLAGSHIGRIDHRTGVAEVLEPPTRDQAPGGSGPTPAAGSG
jgi:virginiamycin B lyase